MLFFFFFFPNSDNVKRFLKNKMAQLIRSNSQELILLIFSSAEVTPYTWTEVHPLLSRSLEWEHRAVTVSQLPGRELKLSLPATVPS